jgi:hypothetical protein
VEEHRAIDRLTFSPFAQYSPVPSASLNPSGLFEQYEFLDNAMPLDKRLQQLVIPFSNRTRLATSYPPKGNAFAKS